MAKRQVDEKGRPVTFITTKTGKKIPIRTKPGQQWHQTKKGKRTLQQAALVKEFREFRKFAQKRYAGYKKKYESSGFSVGRKVGFAVGAGLGGAVLEWGKRGKSKYRRGHRLTRMKGLKALAKTRRGRAGVIMSVASGVGAALYGGALGGSMGRQKARRRTLKEWKQERNR